jgi:hypothetical protein
MSLSPRLLIREIAAWKAWSIARDSVANAARSATRMPSVLSIVPRRAILRPFWSGGEGVFFLVFWLRGEGWMRRTLFEELPHLEFGD